MKTIDILDRLIAFPTTSRSSNRDLISFVSSLMDSAGIDWFVDESADGTRANLFASTGPSDRAGIVLSGHTDVVPTAGQVWTTDPYVLRQAGENLYGRGAADMKGYVASAISAMLHAANRPLQSPLHLALSYDEEIGCVGVRSLITLLQQRSPKPFGVLVGEPTGMRVANGHKGKTALRAHCTGCAGHSALAPNYLNALHLGADFIAILRNEQSRLSIAGSRDGAYEIPYSTVHAGVMRGGTALNIVPDSCEIEFEIRNVAGDEPKVILDRLFNAKEKLVASHRVAFPGVGLDLVEVNAYPGLATHEQSDFIGLFRNLAGDDQPLIKVAFGTEAGLFSSNLGVPSIVCGPGRMEQGHKPDEFIAVSQLAACDAMLARLVQTLESGVLTSAR